MCNILTDFLIFVMWATVYNIKSSTWIVYSASGPQQQTHVQCHDRWRHKAMMNHDWNLCCEQYNVIMQQTVTKYLVKINVINRVQNV
jgi:hypothetical protein